VDGVATDPPPPPPSAFSPPGARAGPVGGTVVNTASRVESVCHGGQVAVSGEVHDALGGVFPDQAAARCPLGEGGGLVWLTTASIGTLFPRPCPLKEISK